MTRKDYKEMANVIQSERARIQTGASEAVKKEHEASLRVTANAFASIAAKDNPRFDRTRFMDACGFSE